MKRLDNKVAVITGAAGGIGTAAARQFVAEGARVLLVDRDEQRLRAMADQLGSACGWAAADVSDPIQVEHFLNRAVEQFGVLDIACFNAGIEGIVAPTHDYPLAEFDRVMAVNSRAVWLGIKYAAPLMRDRGGSVVITSSVAGLQGVEGMSGYVASKHAVVGIMRTAAIEYAPWGIRVNTIHPAPIDTRMMRSVESGFVPDKPEAARGAMEKAIPLKRYGNASEVAGLMVFLASDESSYCTGGTYAVDGGMTAR